MSDAARDLYSFLRSKDFVSEDDENEEPDNDTSHSDSDGGLQSVDTFDTGDANTADSDTTATAGNDKPAEGGRSAGELPSFDGDSSPEALRSLSEKELNRLDYGIIQVDDEGGVEFYNRYESELSGVNPDAAVGKNFFTEVAPCSNNRLFGGRFKKGVRKGELDERFTYTYTYKMTPTLVDVRLYRDEANNNWIMVRKR